MENKTEILGCSEDCYTGKMREFSISFDNITEIERETIKKIINISNYPRFFVEHLTEVNGQITTVIPKYFDFHIQIGYSSYTSMYEYNDINMEAIKSLKKKKIILGMENTYGRGSIGIFIYFTTNCYFYSDFLTRRVLTEKTYNGIK